MNKNKKWWLLRGGILLAVITIIIGGALLKQRREEQEMQSKMETERQAEINMVYKNQNTYLHIRRDRTEYLPYDDYHINELLADLLCYEFETGTVLTYEDIIEYMDSEYEPDGSLRLYNNGNWPEIEAYMDWRTLPEKEDSCKSVMVSLLLFRHDWFEEYPLLEEQEYYDISLHNMLEIIAAYKDDSYEPNFIFD